MIGCMKKEHVTWLSFSKGGLHNLFVKRMQFYVNVLYFVCFIYSGISLTREEEEH